MQYADHARWELLRAAGVDQQRMLDDGIGPVSLETTIKFQQEVRYSDELDVSCQFIWGTGKTFRVHNQLTHRDRRVAAEITNVGGLMDLLERKLVPRPDLRLRELARVPELLNAGH
jgi:acyl-CoA thioester hydrolase